MTVKAKRKGKRGAGQFWQGRRGRLHPKSKPIITPAGRFESLTLAADHYGVTPSAIWRSIARGRPGYRYAKPEAILRDAIHVEEHDPRTDLSHRLQLRRLKWINLDTKLANIMLTEDLSLSRLMRMSDEELLKLRNFGLGCLLRLRIIQSEKRGHNGSRSARRRRLSSPPS